MTVGSADPVPIAACRSPEVRDPSVIMIVTMIVCIVINNHNKDIYINIRMNHDGIMILIIQIMVIGGPWGPFSFVPLLALNLAAIVLTRESGKGGIGQVNRNTQQTNTNKLDFPIPPFLIPPFPISQLTHS